MKLRELAKELKPLIIEQSQLFILIWRRDRQWKYRTLWDRDLVVVEWKPEAKEEMAKFHAAVAEVQEIDPYAYIVAIPDFPNPTIDNIQARIMQHYETTRREVEGK